MWVKLKMYGNSDVWMTAIIMAIMFAAVLTTTAPWKISIEPTTQIVDFGRSALFTCHFEGNSIKAVNWLKDGKDINHHDAILRIDSVKKENTGIYQCFIRNDLETAAASAELKLVGQLPPLWNLVPTDKPFIQGSDAKVECKSDGFQKPQVTWKKVEEIAQFEIKQRNQTARRSEPAVLQCEARGEKPISIIWTKNYMPLYRSDNRYTIREEILPGGVFSDLSIKRTERRDTALFKCIATNAFGSDDIRINMIIQEVPGAAYDLKVLNKSGKSVQLSWAAPYNGNSPIMKYQIEYKRSKGTWEKDIERVLVLGSTTEAKVCSLHPATTYDFRIVAENELGTSEPSDTVTIITAEEAPSEPPSDLKVEPLDQHSLKVTWKPPPMQDCNIDIQGYYVGYKPASTDKAYVFETVDISKETGKEHHLVIRNLKTYTQYSVVVQSFNKMGTGPISEDIKTHTAEGVPSAPPHDALCTTLTAQTIRVSWVSPPLASANGVIKGYKVIYGPSDSWYDETSKDTKITSSSETILHGLKKLTNYSMEILATTSDGDGVRSTPISCQTEQDVPEVPTTVKALVMSHDSILVSWSSPTQPNGVVTHYTVYTQSSGSEPTSNKVPALQMSYSATDVKEARYDFWVTASTLVGEGRPSPAVSTTRNTEVPGKIASFGDSIVASYEEDVKLPCLTVSGPTPSISWKIKGASLVISNRLRQLYDGSLLITGVTRNDAGNYTCLVRNLHGISSVTHKLSINATPLPPVVTLVSESKSALFLRLQPVNATPAHGFTIHYKREFGDWETVQISSQATIYTLENLYCGSNYQVYVMAYNSIGTGEASNVLNARTRGTKPIVPRAADFIEVTSESVVLHMKEWQDGGCPVTHFVVEIKKKGTIEWNEISNSVKPGGNFVILDLKSATQYLLRIIAHNSVGFNVGEYEFDTLNTTEADLQFQYTSSYKNTTKHMENKTREIPYDADRNFVLSLIPHFKQIPEKFKLDAQAEVLMLLKKFKSSE